MMARDEKLPMRAQTMGDRLLDRVLSSTAQLRAGTGLSGDQAKRGMQDLVQMRMAGSVSYGCRLPQAGHHFLMEEGLDHFGASDEQRSWHSRDAIGNLVVYDLPKVESVHDIAPRFAADGWALSRIQFYERKAMAAIAEYRHPDRHLPAYQVFCIPSVIDNQWELCSRLGQLPGELSAQTLDPDQFFFSPGLALVAEDAWGACQALDMARGILSWWVDPAHITAWYHDGDGWRVSDAKSVITGGAPAELSPLTESPEPLPAVASARRLGPRRFDRIISGCRWSGRDGRKQFALLTLLGQYPVISIGHLKALAGEGRRGEETERRLKVLVRLGLAEIVAPGARATAKRLPRGVPLMISERGQGAHHYALTRAGRLGFWYAHGGKRGALYSRCGLSAFHNYKERERERVERNALCRRCGLSGRGKAKEREKWKWSFRHQDGVYEVLAQFREMGCEVAPGWRAHARLANGMTIQPDGVVLLQTPWGRRWCYLEYELSDRSEKAFAPRCAKYGSGHRLESHPLIMVCHDGRAEANFWRAAREYAPEIWALSTTLARLREGGVLGPGVWRRWVVS